MMKSILVLLSLFEAVAAVDPPACRFALNYDKDMFSKGDDQSSIDKFIDEYYRGEAQWIRGIGTEYNGGWTLDGIRLDVNTGLPCEYPHNWTASSKECMQMFLIARILYDSAVGATCDACKIWSKDEALSLLDLKLNAYNGFIGAYPGFGSYFPWMKVDLNTGNARPDEPDWNNHVPALDNAELFWPLWAVSEVLNDKYIDSQADMAGKAKTIVNSMMTNARKIFYNETKPGIRTDSFLVDQLKTVDENTYAECDYSNPDKCVYAYLDDPYEGELFLDMLTAFPTETGFNVSELDTLWDMKRAKTVKDSIIIEGVTYETEQGYTFSSHEKWKYLMVPYLESKMQQNVFYSGEKIRTMYAASINSPGLWGAMTGTMNNNTMDPGYHSDVGIPDLASQTVAEDFFITPYGAYPVILANRTVGMAWLLNMIRAPRGQNCFGTTEGFHTSGENVSSIVTWDTKVTNVMALLGGISDITKNYLSAQNKLQPLVDRWEDQWKDFGSLAGYDQATFTFPNAEIPSKLADYSTCNSTKYACFTQSGSDTSGVKTNVGMLGAATVIISLISMMM